MPITVLPYWLNIDYISILRLTSLILSLSISGYLFKIKKKARPTLFLALTFLGASIFNLAMFLEHANAFYWQPYNLKSLVQPYLQQVGPSIALLSLMLFSYHFPHFIENQRREYRIAFSIFVTINLFALGLTFYNFTFLQRGYSNFRFEPVYFFFLFVSFTCQFAYIITLLIRKTILLSSNHSRSIWRRLKKPRDRDAEAVRSIARVLLLLLGVMSVYFTRSFGILDPVITLYLVWFIFLFFYTSFVVAYLNHTSEFTALQAKIIGTALVTVLGISGIVGVITGKTYENDYRNDDLIADNQTIHFERNQNESYDVSRNTLRFEQDLGARLEIDYGESVGIELKFSFPFFNESYRYVQILHGPMIYLGLDNREDGWGGYHPLPAIAPLIMNLDPDGGGGIFLTIETNRIGITWYELPEYGSFNKNTIQLILYRDGSFDFSYKELDPVGSYRTARPNVFTTAKMKELDPGLGRHIVAFEPRLIGIHPGQKKAVLLPVRFMEDLPYSDSVSGIIFEDYDIGFQRYLHKRMAPQALLLLASSLFIMFLFPILFKLNLTKPLHALYSGIQKANNGDLDVSVTPQFNDEIGFLSTTFNQMLQSIKKVESNFRALADNTQDGILITTPDSIPEYVNKRASIITGFSIEELAKKSCWKLFPSDIREKMYREAGIDSEDDYEAIQYETFVKHKNGTNIPVELSVSRTAWHGRLANVLVIRDITERKRSEEQSREQQQRLMQMDKLTSLGVLVAGVAHEINNPNQTILSNTSLLKRACPEIVSILQEFEKDNEDFYIAGLEYPEFQKRFPDLLNSVKECSTRIDGIVNNLKAFSADIPTNLMTYMDINIVISSAVKLASGFIKKATENFIVETAPDLPKIKGNALRLEQVLINLILNACQSLPDRERAISIKSVYKETDKAVIIEVLDEGVGITEEYLAIIKEPFFTTKRAEGGSGLGLYVSNAIIEEHRGSLSFSSEEGKGTKVVIRLPAGGRDED